MQCDVCGVISTGFAPVSKVHYCRFRMLRFRAHLLFAFAVTLLPLTAAVSLFASGALGWVTGFIYIGYDTALLVFVTVTILRVLRKPRPAFAPPISRPRLAVLICGRNEEAVIGQCLAALTLQTEPADTIHFIDDGSLDLSVQKVSESFPNVRIWKKPHSGKADSLNQVWPQIASDILVTLDADTLLDPDALKEVRRAFVENPNLCAAGGVLTPTCLTAGFMGRVFESFQRFEYVRAFLSRRAWMENNALLLVSGAFAAYKKSALEAVGGYDTQSLVEDYALIHRIHRYAFEHNMPMHVGVIATAAAKTDAPHNFRAFLKQRERWFGGFLQTHFQNWDMIGSKKYGKVGMLMLPIKSLDTVQPIYGLIAFSLLVRLLVLKQPLSPIILSVIVVKLIFDLVFHFWSIHLYHRWQGLTVSRRLWVTSALVSMTEPFSFQLLRHVGALLGWFTQIRRRHEWVPGVSASLLAFLISSRAMGGDATLPATSAPFWKAKADVYKSIIEDRKIVVSAKTDEVKEGATHLKTLSVVSAGLVKTPLKFAFEEIQHFEKLKQIDSRFEEVRYEAPKKQLYLDIGVYGYHSRMKLQIRPEETDSIKVLFWESIEGSFKGMKGEFKLEDHERQSTEISMTAFFKSATLPLPRVLMGVGLEVVAQRIASEMREAIESAYKNGRVK